MLLSLPTPKRDLCFTCFLNLCSTGALDPDPAVFRYFQLRVKGPAQQNCSNIFQLFSVVLALDAMRTGKSLDFLILLMCNLSKPLSSCEPQQKEIFSLIFAAESQHMASRPSTASPHPASAPPQHLPAPQS